MEFNLSEKLHEEGFVFRSVGKSPPSNGENGIIKLDGKMLWVPTAGDLFRAMGDSFYLLTYHSGEWHANGTAYDAEGIERVGRGIGRDVETALANLWLCIKNYTPRKK